MPEGSWNWPERNCAVEADEAGAFIGQNFTETDAMSPEEILEAYTCLDDLGAFLLEAKYNPQFSPDERSRAREFAWHAFHMIGRRTIRDLIIRAQSDLSPEKYRRGREQILSRDRGQESTLKELAPTAEPWPDIFYRFLAHVKFRNGFGPMKVLSIPNRIKWMKVCAALWGALDQKFSLVGFAADEEEQGEPLNELLDSLSGAAIDDLLERVEQGQKLHLTKPDGTLEIFGLRFDFKKMDNGVELHRIAVS